MGLACLEDKVCSVFYRFRLLWGQHMGCLLQVRMAFEAKYGMSLHILSIYKIIGSNASYVFHSKTLYNVI